MSYDFYLQLLATGWISSLRSVADWQAQPFVYGGSLITVFHLASSFSADTFPYHRPICILLDYIILHTKLGLDIAGCPLTISEW
jgi:hypothetical protein